MKRTTLRWLAVLAALAALAALAGCTPKPKEHRELPPGAGPAAVTNQDPAATRNADPGNQKQQP